MPQVKIKIQTNVEDIGDRQDTEEIKEKKKQPEATTNLFTHAMISQAKSIMNYSISNIGNLTGDSIKQENIQKTMGYVQDIATVALGFKSGGWVGATIAVAGMTINKGLEIASYFIDQKHKSIERDYLLERSGNSTINGSRGTEN